MKIAKRISKNNRGATLVELMMTFALLAIFMVAGTRIISYTIGIYYSAKGNTNAYQVTSIIYDKVSGMIENAVNSSTPPTVNADGTFSLVDSTGSDVVIGLGNQKGELDRKYLVIHYAPTSYNGNMLEATDWYYDEKLYLGYSIKELVFADPNSGVAPGNEKYPENVVKMNITVTSPKYGDFSSTYYIKCFNCDVINFME